MEIKRITGLSKSPELTVTKSIGSIILASSLAPSELVDELISVYVERGNGSNVILLNKIKLIDFILSSTYGSEAIQSNDDFETIALCELSQDGSIFLDDKETIKIVLENLNPTATYVLNGIEEPLQVNDLYFFEQKSIASEEVNKKIDVKGYDLAIMTMDSSISDISYTFQNGQVVKYLPFELQTLSADIDPVQHISQTGTVSISVPTKVTLPLVHVDFIEVNKSQGALINFVVRTLKTV